MPGEVIGVSRLLAILGSLLKVRSSSQLEQRRRILQEVVTPSWKLIAEVHGDYMASFTDLRSMVGGEKVPTIELVEWLRRESNAFVAQRTELRALAADPGRYEGVFRKAPNTQKAFRAFVLYCGSVESYFAASLGFSEMSWYTDALDRLDSRVRDFDRVLQRGGRMLSDLDLEALRSGSHEDSELQEVFTRRQAMFADPGDQTDDLDVDWLNTTLRELPARFQEVTYRYHELWAALSE